MISYSSARLQKVRASFHSVIEKVRGRLANWKGRLLNKAGRLCLINSVAASIPVYHMQDKPWVALLRAKYQRNEGVLDGPVPCNASHAWKSISKAFGALKDAFSRCVGSLDQSFWFDNWSIEGPIAQDVPFVHISDSDLTIRDVWKDGQWNLHDIFSIIPEDVKQRLNAYNPDLNAGESSGWSWGVASSRLYSARSGYSWLAKRKFDWNEHDNWVWRLHIPEKYKFLIWLSLHNAIPTAEFRLGRGLALSSTCHRCQNGSESIFHCLRECPSAKEVWTLLGLYSDSSNLHDWLYRCARSGDVFLFFSTICSVREFHTIFAMHQSLSPPSLCLHWVPPPVHSVKLNCDASWFAPSGYAGFGCIIRNPDGCWLKGCTGKVEVCSVLFAELYAIWRGLLLAWESRFRERTANSVADCMAKAAVADIHSNWSQPWSELQHLIDLDMTLAN
ncbi:Putative ribonuclease H protein [Arachis hypogaea]|nr:Putative ribonuclease H protein [Arachis hypogaea]